MVNRSHFLQEYALLGPAQSFYVSEAKKVYGLALNLVAVQWPATDPSRAPGPAIGRELMELSSELLPEAWQAYGDPRRIEAIREISAEVSTNRVYALSLSDGSRVIAKVSAYGSYFQFREDHVRISQWKALLKDSTYRDFLAAALLKNGQLYTYYNGRAWAVFYQEAPNRETLPRILEVGEIENFGRQMAQFHRACARLSRRMAPASKSLKSDIMMLLALLKIRQWQEESHFSPEEADFLRAQCESFLFNVEELGYEGVPRMPVLIDWNIGNFSIQRDAESFHLCGRWDYDWFRVEPRILDFYFCSRVVSSIGDRTQFSYLAETLLEERFRRFVSAYNKVYPISRQELALLKEAYRFFILNYVIKDGEHFFREGYSLRLKREAVSLYLPRLDALPFGEVADFLLG